VSAPVPLEYDVEETDGALVPVVRLRLPEKLARTLSEAELPAWPRSIAERPVRFVVTRGQRGAVRAGSLAELQDKLDAPWTDEEIAAHQRARDVARSSSRKGGGRGDPKRGGDGRPGGGGRGAGGGRGSGRRRR
jgi:ATP-dependent helicase HrpA